MSTKHSPPDGMQGMPDSFDPQQMQAMIEAMQNMGMSNGNGMGMGGMGGMGMHGMDGMNGNGMAGGMPQLNFYMQMMQYFQALQRNGEGFGGMPGMPMTGFGGMSGMSPPQQDPKIKVTVEGMQFQYQLTEDDLHKVFSRYGSVKTIKVHEGGSGATISFQQYQDASAAMQDLDGKVLNGLDGTLRINWASEDRGGNAFGNAPSLPYGGGWGFPGGVPPWPQGGLESNMPNMQRSGDGAGKSRGADMGDMGSKGVRKYTCRFLIGIENDKEFQVARRIIGSKGSNMKRVVKYTEAKLRLRGAGSGYFEGAGQKESTEPLQLCVSCMNYDGYKTAINQIVELLNRTYEEYRQFCRDNGRPVPDLHVNMSENQLVYSNKAGENGSLGVMDGDSGERGGSPAQFSKDGKKAGKKQGRGGKGGKDSASNLSSPEIDRGEPGPNAPSVEEIEGLVDQRNEARRAGNFAEADRIRALLHSKALSKDDTNALSPTSRPYHLLPSVGTWIMAANFRIYGEKTDETTRPCNSAHISSASSAGWTAQADEDTAQIESDITKTLPNDIGNTNSSNNVPPLFGSNCWSLQGILPKTPSASLDTPKASTGMQNTSSGASKVDTSAPQWLCSSNAPTASPPASNASSNAPKANPSAASASGSYSAPNARSSGPNANPSTPSAIPTNAPKANPDEPMTTPIGMALAISSENSYDEVEAQSPASGSEEEPESLESTFAQISAAVGLTSLDGSCPSSFLGGSYKIPVSSSPYSAPLNSTGRKLVSASPQASPWTSAKEISAAAPSMEMGIRLAAPQGSASPSAMEIRLADPSISSARRIGCTSPPAPPWTSAREISLASPNTSSARKINPASPPASPWTSTTEIRFASPNILSARRIGCASPSASPWTSAKEISLASPNASARKLGSGSPSASPWTSAKDMRTASPSISSARKIGSASQPAPPWTSAKNINVASPNISSARNIGSASPPGPLLTSAQEIGLASARNIGSASPPASPAPPWTSARKISVASPNMSPPRNIRSASPPGPLLTSAQEIGLTSARRIGSASPPASPAPPWTSAKRIIVASPNMSSARMIRSGSPPGSLWTSAQETIRLGSKETIDSASPVASPRTSTKQLGRVPQPISTRTSTNQLRPASPPAPSWTATAEMVGEMGHTSPRHPASQYPSGVPPNFMSGPGRKPGGSAIRIGSPPHPGWTPSTTPPGPGWTSPRSPPHPGWTSTPAPRPGWTSQTNPPHPGRILGSTGTQACGTGSTRMPYTTRSMRRPF